MKISNFFDANPSQKQVKLQVLANEIADVMDLPDDMKITVHYSDEATVNAFATLGGNVFMFKGLIEKLQSEDALAAVLAHEIAHIKHRHPISVLGKGLSIIAVAGLLTGSSSANNILINQTVNVGLLQFSRSQETQSDIEAMHVLQKRYQHIGGAKELFDVFNQMQAKATYKQPEFFSSHPHSDNRWLRLKKKHLI